MGGAELHTGLPACGVYSHLLQGSVCAAFLMATLDSKQTNLPPREGQVEKATCTVVGFCRLMILLAGTSADALAPFS